MARKNWIDPQTRNSIYTQIDRIGFLKFLGSRYVKNVGNGEIRGTCPIHQGDDETAFRLYPDTNWVCETEKCHNLEKQDIFSLVQRVQGVKFPVAVQIVAEFCGIKVDIEDVNSSNIDGINNYSWASSANPNKPEKELKINIEPSLIYKYMAQRTDHMIQRGFTEQTLNDFEIGHAYDWLTIKNLEHFNLPSEERITIPIKFNNKYVSIQGRCVIGQGTSKKCPENPWPRDKKYDNLKEFEKSLVLFNWDRAVEYAYMTNRILIAEGAPNTMKWHQVGIPNVVATLGSEISEDHIKLLAQGIWRVCLAYDTDKAGNRGTQKFIDQTKHLFDIEVLPHMPLGKDAEQCTPEELYYAYTHPKRLLLT